jgi:nucleotide-binding universal stress UspA family protein
VIGHLLVALDGSEHSQKALEFACDLAQRFGAPLNVLHVPRGTVEGRTLVLGGAAVSLHATDGEIAAAGQAVLEAALAIARDRGVADVRGELGAGDPVDAILEAAGRPEIDTLVVGSRGLGDLSGLVLGSVSHRVAQQAPVTCITVR